MSGKSILITGCSSGIGLCAAETLKARGWRVFATARKPEDIASLKREGFESLYLDYAEQQSIAAAADEVLDATGGRLDGLFNNGAYGQPGAVEDLRREVLRAQFEAGFFGWHDLTRRVVTQPVASLRGRRIVAVAGGAVKVDAIRAVLASRLLSGLITDERTARGIVEPARAPAMATAP